MLRLLLGPAIAAAMAMGATPVRREAGDGALWRRGYEDNDPKTDMCEVGFHASTVLDNKLWVHGGYIGYNNGTKSAAPNTYLREIDLSVKFVAASSDEAPIKFLLQDDEVPEISAGLLWGYENTLLELPGESEPADKKFPGWNAPTDGEMWEYDLPSAAWSSKAIKSPGVRIIAHSLEVNVPSLGKGYYLGDSAMSTYDWADDTWTNASTPWSERGWGRMVHLPIGDRGLLVTISGTTVGGNAPDGHVLSSIDIFNLNEAGTASSPEGVWAASQTATAANSTIGIPLPRSNACIWAAAAPDNSTYQIFMYSGAAISGGYKIYRDLWVLSIPSFEWIQIDDGTVGPREPDATHPLGREGHTCNVVGNSMMMMFGGRELPNFSRPCETTGIYVYDMNKLSWVETYDPAVAAQQYNVSEAVYSVVGGNALGSGPSARMAKINDPSLKTVFDAHLATVSDITTSISPSDPSGTGANGGSGDNSGDGGSGSNTGAIAGGVVGGVVAVAGIVAAILLLRRRGRKTREQTTTTPNSLGSSGPMYAEMDSSEPEHRHELPMNSTETKHQHEHPMDHEGAVPQHQQYPSQLPPSQLVELPTSRQSQHY